MLRLDIRRARTLREFMGVRSIRNESSSYMTRNRRKISIWQQISFWFQVRAYDTPRVYVGYIDGRVVAYGLLRDHWVSGAVTGDLRAQGLGRQLFQFLTIAASKPARLEVFDWNHRARGLYQSLGWKIRAQRGNVIEMVYE